MNLFTHLQHDPAELRKSVLHHRKNLSVKERANHFSSILQRLTQFSPYLESKNILAYCGKVSSGEFDTRPLLLDLIRIKNVFLPKSNAITRTLELFQIHDLKSDIALGMYNIMEPVPNLCKKGSIEQIDLVLVPGSVFDKHGGRYGYGAGYYDSMLANFHGIKVALALESTVMSFDLKLHSKDIKMDFVITENSIYSNI